MERERERETQAFSVGFFLNMPSSECSRLAPVPCGCTAVHNITTRGIRVGTVVVQLDSVGEHFILRLVRKRIVAIYLLLFQPYRTIMCILSNLNLFRTSLILMKTVGIVNIRTSSLTHIKAIILLSVPPAQSGLSTKSKWYCSIRQDFFFFL